ncbi:uncharacterized protein PAC_09829 [Phialocephala subalpina]|uniref:WW domain-containing protein n=1 Tax=Phialocephala subalpina TaxID=576137 RepID=A0A1L7X4J4_9HELO|nr:uncharacterized protein PAC_09829 [Phialocephala subalpina]
MIEDGPGSRKDVGLTSWLGSDKLPKGWELGYTSDDRPYFLDHNTKTNTWRDPRMRHQKVAILKHFFNKDIREDVGGLDLLLRTLLAQLLQFYLQNSIGSQAIDLGFTISSANPIPGPMSLEEAFLTTLEALDSQSVVICLVIDAIDQCRDRSHCMKFVNRLLSSKKPGSIALHVCISKRDYPIMDIPSPAFNIRMDEYNTPDIKEYMGSNWVDSNPLGTSFLAAKTPLARPYWIKVLNGLAREPSLDWEVCARLLSCALTWQTPLDAREILFACDCHDDDSLEIESSDVDKALLSASGGLLRAPNGSVDGKLDFVQPILREILMTWSQEEQSPMATDDDILLACILEGNISLLNACMRRLRKARDEYESNNEWSKLLPPYENITLPPMARHRVLANLSDYNKVFQKPFLKYAVEHMVHHLGSLVQKDIVIEVLSELEAPPPEQSGDFLKIIGLLTNLQLRQNLCGTSTTVLHLLTIRNASKLIKLWYGNGVELGRKLRPGNGPSALHLAAFLGLEEAAGALLDLEETTSRSGSDTPPPTTVGDWVQRRPYLASLTDENLRTPLHLSVIQGQDNVASLLFSRHSDLGAIAAAEHHAVSDFVGHDDVFKEVCSPKELLDLQDIDGNTALHLAIEFCRLKSVEFLLYHGATFSKLQSKNLKETPEALATRLGSSGRDALSRMADKNGQNVDDITRNIYPIVRMLKATAFAEQDLAVPPRSPESADFKFSISRVRAPLQGGGGNYSRDILPFAEFINMPLEDGGPRMSRWEWIHIPANNMRWIEAYIPGKLVMHKVCQDSSMSGNILQRALWTNRQHRGSARSHTPFMRPGYQVVPGNDRAKVIFMPFIHWQTEKRHVQIQTFLQCRELLRSNGENLQSLVKRFKTEDSDFLKPAEESGNSPDALFRAGRFIQVQRTLQAYLDIIESSEIEAKTETKKAKKTKKAKGTEKVEERKMEMAENDLHQALRDYESTWSNDDEMQLIKTYAHDAHPLHMRRSLDQSFYHMLDSTATRDKDQVVSRHGKRLGRTPVIMMVDQLWMWNLGKTVITSFSQRQPDKEDTSQNKLDEFGMTDVFESVYRNLPAGSFESTSTYLMNTIMTECIAMHFDPARYLDEDFRFFEIFESSIGSITDKEAAAYNRFMESLNTRDEQDLSDIKAESRLVREIKDIQDELTIMGQVFKDQKQVVKSLGPLGYEEKWDLDSQLKTYLEKVHMMQEQAKTAYASLKDLMDLRQAHANLSEAKNARKQAVDTGKQGNTIMVFTIVTILFLPASFMASFFALPVEQFQRTDGTNPQLKLSYVVKWMTTFTMPLAVFFIGLAFFINQILDILWKVVGQERTKDSNGLTRKSTTRKQGGEQERPSIIGVTTGTHIGAHRQSEDWRETRSIRGRVHRDSIV